MNISLQSNVMFFVVIRRNDSFDTEMFYDFIRRKKHFDSLFLLRRKCFVTFTKKRSVIFFIGGNERNVSVTEKISI